MTIHDLNLSLSEYLVQAQEPIFPTTIGGILRARAAATPDRMAVAEPDRQPRVPGQLARSLDYGELLTIAERLTSALLTRFQPGERLAIWSPNSLEWVVFEFAAAMAGMTFVTVNPSSQAREVTHILKQSGAVALFAVKAYRGNPIWEIASKVVAGLPQVRELVDLDNPQQLYAGQRRRGDLPVVRPEDPAMIIYTSGTTGVPKGVVLNHRGVTNGSRLQFDRLDPPEASPIVTAAPLFHVGGCVGPLLGSVQHGSPIVLLSHFEPGLILDLVETHRAGMICGVPTMLISMLEAQEASPRDVSSLERVLCGGAMIAPELIRRTRLVLGADVQTIYGQTEYSGTVTQTYLDDDVIDTSETVGRPLPMTDVSIRDLGDGTPVAIGAIGEICVRGYGVMQEYNDNPEATAATIDDQGWLHTGDLGCMDSRGYVRVTGRLKEMIIRGGENIYPAEIESLLIEHSSVAEVAVVGIPDERWGEIVCCFIRTAGGVAMDQQELIRHCRASLSPQKTPSRWIAVEEWPLTGSGKIQKFTLRDMVVAGEFD